MVLGCVYNSSQIKYPDNEEILLSLEEISSSLADVKNSSLVTIGYSVENNPIKLLKISGIKSYKILFIE